MSTPIHRMITAVCDEPDCEATAAVHLRIPPENDGPYWGTARESRQRDAVRAFTGAGWQIGPDGSERCPDHHTPTPNPTSPDGYAHLAGSPLTIAGHTRQRCLWCGVLVHDDPTSTLPTIPVGRGPNGNRGPCFKQPTPTSPGFDPKAYALSAAADELEETGAYALAQRANDGWRVDVHRRVPDADPVHLLTAHVHAMSDGGFPGPSAGHRLIERGWIVRPCAHSAHDRTPSGWKHHTGNPEQWTAPVVETTP